MTIETPNNKSNLPLINLSKEIDNSSFNGSAKSGRALSERIVYRSSRRFPDLNESRDDSQSVVDHTECPRCHSVIPIRVKTTSKESKTINANSKSPIHNQRTRSRHSVVKAEDSGSCYNCECSMSRKQPKRTISPRKQVARLHKGKLYKSVENVDWNDLGNKIENWFEDAKTPDQRAVYNFLQEIQDEDDKQSVISENPGEKVKSLEDILDNLKKYRTKFEQKSYIKSAIFPQLNKRSNQQALGNLFESSTWRVMRHIRSADVRNKYPLPKANPDEYFRNSTIFQVAGRTPKSTFLLHPEWV